MASTAAPTETIANVDPLASPTAGELLAGDRVMGDIEADSDNVNIDDEISKLLSTEAVMSEQSPETFSLGDSLIDQSSNDGGDPDKTSLAELHPDKVKETALDDKLSIELQSIVKQIQVLLIFNQRLKHVKYISNQIINDY